MSKRMLWMFGLCLVLILLAGCGQEQQKETVEKKTKKEEIQIGISFDSFVIERWIRDRDVFVSTATKLGAQVNVQNANGDVKEQISQIEYFIDKQMDVIAIIPVDCDSLSEVVKKAKEQGIRVISYDRLIKNANTDLYLSFDNEEVGRLMAQNLKENLPEGGEIFMIKGAKEDNNVAMIEQGFGEVIEDTNLKIVYSANCEGWLAEDAFGYVNEGLKQYPDVAAIVCGNDDLASYAFRALAENRKAGKVLLIGQDGDLSACQHIVEGTQSMTVFKSVDELAKQAAQCAIKLAGNEALGIKDTINDGGAAIPYQKLEPVAVTKDNIDEVIIDGGFHLREDVYLNVKDQ